MHKTLSNRLLLYIAKKIHRTNYSFLFCPKFNVLQLDLSKGSLNTKLTVMNCSTRDTNYLTSVLKKPEQTTVVIQYYRFF